MSLLTDHLRDVLFSGASQVPEQREALRDWTIDAGFCRIYRVLADEAIIISNIIQNFWSLGQNLSLLASVCWIALKSR